MAAVVIAYTLINFSLLEVDDFYYQFLNVFGSLGILINAFYHRDYPAAILNMIWIAVAIIIIVKGFF